MKMPPVFQEKRAALLQVLCRKVIGIKAVLTVSSLNCGQVLFYLLSQHNGCFDFLFRIAQIKFATICNAYAKLIQSSI